MPAIVHETMYRIFEQAGGRVDVQIIVAGRHAGWSEHRTLQDAENEVQRRMADCRSRGLATTATKWDGEKWAAIAAVAWDDAERTEGR
jgi:hypothetical protein